MRSSSFANRNKLILVIEDDKETAKYLIETLENEGYKTDWKQNGPQVLQIDNKSLDEYYCVLLDLGIAGLDPAKLGYPELSPCIGGLQLLDKWRKANIWVPVIIVTNRIEIENQIKGMSYKPDDYITKDRLVPALLVSRIEMVTNRRVKRPEPKVLTFEGVTLNETQRELFGSDGKAISLTAKEYSVMECLMDSRGAYCTEEQLNSYIYDMDYDYDKVTAKSSALDVTLHDLRKKIQKTPIMIKNSRGMGWKLAKRV